MRQRNNISGNDDIIQVNAAWYKRIFVKTTLVIWGLIILALLIFIFGTLPSQRKMLEDRMKSEANDIAGSIGQVTSTAIINNDFGSTVEHCLKIIKQSNSIVYIIITRKDGFSLIHVADKWRQEENLKDQINLPDDTSATSGFIYSSLAGQKVFHYSYPFGYSGIEWGRINVGLSLKKYEQDISSLYSRTAFLALISIVVGFFVSLAFTRKLTRPILQLDKVSQTVAKGDLSARAEISSDDELGRLAFSFNNMTESLKNSQEDLEQKVEERTAELGQANKLLQIEISERLQAEDKLKQYNSRLEALDEIYRGIISAKSVDEIITETISNINKLFQHCSKAYVSLNNSHTKQNKTFSSFITGVSRSERNIVVSDASENCPMDSEPLSSLYSIEDLTQFNDKTDFENKLFNAGIRSFVSAPLIVDDQIIGKFVVASETPHSFDDNDKEVLLVITNQLAVAIYQAQLQTKIREHAQNLQNSLSEKEVLLKEIHHRVKNNLQVISSLLYLSSAKIKDNETREIFSDSQNRVKSIALVHERLYQSKDLNRIDFREYVSRLTNDLFRSYAVNQILIKLFININDIFISIDTAVPCGLIINELISNSLKYAFPDKEKGNCEIRIEFYNFDNNESVMIISDNGIGLPEGLDIKKASSLGLQLVETLVDQLEGSLHIDNSQGTSFSIKFKNIIGK